jgi:tetratricopeptide (TPR) repeat protein
MYQRLMAGRRILVVLDNARDPAQVRPLLPGSPRGMVLVTSRDELTGLVCADGARPVGLDVLTPAEASRLLAARLGSARLAAEPAAAAALIALCARLPLALAITAARAAARPGFSLAALAAGLRDERGRLDALATGEEATDPRVVFSWSYHQLSPAAAWMFRLAGLHPGPDISVAAAASMGAVSLPEARRLLLELTRGNLLAEPAPDRYALHDLLRAYAVNQAAVADDEQARRAAIRRMLDHYLHTAHAAALLLKPSRERISLTPPLAGVMPECLASHRQALDWLEAEHKVLLAAVSLAAETGFDQCAWQLAVAMDEFLDWRGRWRESAAVQRTALAAATRLGDTAGQAVAGRVLGTACSLLADYDQALAFMASSLGLYRELGDRGGQARVHQVLGWVAMLQGRRDDALGHAEQALALFEAVADRAGQAAALNNAGLCHVRLGDPRRARALCQQALALNQELGVRRGEAHAWDNLGYAEHELGHYSDAVSCYQNALRLFRDLQDRFNQAEILDRLGDAHRTVDDRRQAHDAWQQALDILDELHRPEADQVRAKLEDLRADRGSGLAARHTALSGSVAGDPLVRLLPAPGPGCDERVGRPGRHGVSARQGWRRRAGRRQVRRGRRACPAAASPAHYRAPSVRRPTVSPSAGPERASCRIRPSAGVRRGCAHAE